MPDPLQVDASLIWPISLFKVFPLNGDGYSHELASKPIIVKFPCLDLVFSESLENLFNKYHFYELFTSVLDLPESDVPVYQELPVFSEDYPFINFVNRFVSLIELVPIFIQIEEILLKSPLLRRECRVISEIQLFRPLYCYMRLYFLAQLLVLFFELIR